MCYFHTYFSNSQLLQSIRIHVLVSANPDGGEKAEMGSCNGDKGKTNADGIDLDTAFTG